VAKDKIEIGGKSELAEELLFWIGVNTTVLSLEVENI